MAEEQEQFAAGREFVRSVNQYAEVIELQLIAVRTMIEGAVDQVMAGVKELSSELELKSKHAEKALEETFVTPDAKTSELVTNIQGSVDQVFSEALQHLENKPVPETPVDQKQQITSGRLRRMGGRFTKHMEALSTMDQEISKIVYHMISALSNDDVIRQKLEHLLHSVQALKIGLSYVLIDFKERFTVQEIEMLRKDLLLYTYRQFTSEHEKQLFRSLFEAPADSATESFIAKRTGDLGSA